MDIFGVSMLPGRSFSAFDSDRSHRERVARHHRSLNPIFPAWFLRRTIWSIAATVLALCPPVLAQATDTWSAASNLAVARYHHTATLLPSTGKVLVVGGDNGGSTFTSVEMYDPVSNTWSAAAALATGRTEHTATMLPSGKVFVAGGFNGAALTSAELYDPTGKSWSPAGSMATARGYHTATLLPSGKVLIAGGLSDSGFLASAELFDPACNTWSAAGSMATPRGHHTATLLTSGKMLVAGGYNGSSVLASAELYEPASNSWSSVGNLVMEHFDPTATLLRSGSVLVVGGRTIVRICSPVSNCTIQPPIAGVRQAVSRRRVIFTPLRYCCPARCWSREGWAAMAALNCTIPTTTDGTLLAGSPGRAYSTRQPC